MRALKFGSTIGALCSVAYWFCGACAQHAKAKATRASSSDSTTASPPLLIRLPAGNLCDAYAVGGADAQYRGKRYTIVGNVLGADAGAHRVLLGSNLRPIVAVGIDDHAAAALCAGSAIEIDCVVTGATVGIPNLDCGPNGLPRPVAPQH